MNLIERTQLLAGIEQRAFIDIDSLLRPIYGQAKQGASFGQGRGLDGTRGDATARAAGAGGREIILVRGDSAYGASAVGIQVADAVSPTTCQVRPRCR